MQDAMIIKKFASDVANFMPIMAQQLNNLHQELQDTKAKLAMSKQANAPTPKVFMDDTRLRKAANAMVSTFGSTSNTTPESMYMLFKNNPDAILDCLVKTASAREETVVKAEYSDMGKLKENKKMPKNASSKKVSSDNAIQRFNQVLGI